MIEQRSHKLNCWREVNEKEQKIYTSTDRMGVNKKKSDFGENLIQRAKAIHGLS